MKTKTSDAKEQERVGALLGCPHCGASPDALDKRTGKGVYAYMNAPHSDTQQWLHVACLECGSGSPSVQTWNRRQPNMGDGAALVSTKEREE